MIDLKKMVILDTETTGLDSNSEVIEVGIIDAETGNILMDQKVKPRFSVPDSAVNIHGITNEMLSDQPFWDDIHLDFLNCVNGKKILIYNSDYDTRLISQTMAMYFKPKRGLHHSVFSSFVSSHVACVMQQYATQYGEYDQYRGCYRWQKLTNAAAQQNIDISDLTAHRASSDCEITRRLILAMNDKKNFVTYEMSGVTP